MGVIDLKKLVPNVILNDFYIDLLDAISDELELFKSDRITPRIDMYNVRELSSVTTNIDALINIADTFGYIPNVSLTPANNISLTEFYKREIESIAFRIRRKTTYAGYDYIFKSIPSLGYIYNMYYDGTKLIRAMNYNDHNPKILIANGDGVSYIFQYIYDKPDLYVHQSIVIYQNTTNLNVSATNAATEHLTTSPDVAVGNYTRSLGLLTFRFYTPPAPGDNIYLELQINVDDTNLQLDTYNFLDPFVYSLPEYYYSFVEDNSFTLDNGYSLDNGYTLDTDILKELTHHLMVEYLPIRLLVTEKLVGMVGDGSTTSFVYSYTDFAGYINQYIYMYKNSNNLNVICSNASTEILTTSPNIGSGTYVRATGVLSFTFLTAPAIGETIYIEFGKSSSLTGTTGNIANDLQLDYISYYVNNYNKKVTEIPHVGVQISMVTDDSGYYDNLKPTKPDTYTVNVLKAKLSTTLDYPGTDGNIEDIFYEVMAGSGASTMYSYGSVISSINMTDQYYTKRLAVGESEDTGDYYKVNTYIPLNTAENYILFSGNSTTYQVTGTIGLSWIPAGELDIIPKSFNLKYYANNLEYNFSDITGNGVLGAGSNVFNGTIAYDTGLYTLEFRNVTASVDLGIVVTKPGATLIAGNTSNTPINQSSFLMEYAYSGGNYTITYAGANTLVSSGSHISSGTLDSAGNYSIQFTVEIDDSTVDIYYEYYLYSIPVTGTTVTTTFKTSSNLPITEVGILNKSGNVVLYSTIPPIDCTDRNSYYLGIHYYVKK